MANDSSRQPYGNGIPFDVIGGAEASQWEAFATAYPLIAGYIQQPDVFKKYVDSMVKLLFKRPKRESSKRRFDQCGELLLTQLSFAIRHTPPAAGRPLDGKYFITKKLIQNQAGAFISFATDHFRFFADAEIEGTNPGALFEALHAAYRKDFRRAPAPPPNGGPIDVIFCQLGGVRGMTAPDWPILLNEKFWKDLPDLRRSLAAHELFHRLQYAFGFRGESAPTHNNPNPRVAWFSEGGASWAECIYNAAVTNSQKILALRTLPQIGLLNSSYYSCPVWMSRAGTNKSEAKRAVRDILHAYEIAPEPGRAVDAFSGGANIQTLYLDYLKAAMFKNGRASGIRGMQGNALKNLKLAIDPKVVNLDDLTLPFRTSGTVARQASEFYRVEGRRSRVDVQVTAGVELTVFGTTQPEPGPIQAAASRATLRTPFLIAVTGTTAESQQFTLAIGEPGLTVRKSVRTLPEPSRETTVPENYSYRMDCFGNVLVAGQGCKVALGFQVGAYASFGGEDPASPGGNLDWWMPGKPSDPTGVKLKLREGFQPADISVVRTVAQQAGASGTQLLVTTKVTTNKATPFYFLLQTSNATSSVDQKLSLDGMGEKGSDPSNNENDGDTKPLWLARITIEGVTADPDEAIVPYPGRVWVPLPSVGAGEHTIVERYQLMAMLP